jgi:hypothetical protein
MTKNELIYHIKNILAKEDESMEFHPKQIEAVIDDVYAQTISDLGIEELNDFDFNIKESFSNTVTLDATSGRYYTDLPRAILNLRQPQKGVVEINTNQGTDMNFVPTTIKRIRLLLNSEAYGYTGKVHFYVERDKIWYYNMTSDLANAGVRLRLAVPFSEFSATDEVPLPVGKDTEFVQTVIQILAQTQPSDLKNDNA